MIGPPFEPLGLVPFDLTSALEAKLAQQPFYCSFNYNHAVWEENSKVMPY